MSTYIRRKINGVLYVESALCCDYAAFEWNSRDGFTKLPEEKYRKDIPSEEFLRKDGDKLPEGRWECAL